MTGIKYFALDENEEVPYEFVVTRNVNGEPEFCASFVNTNTLTYGNDVLLKFHQRNDELRAENAKLREAVATAIKVQAVLCGDADSLYCRNKCPLHRPESNDCLACDVIGVAQELGIEV